MRFQMRRDKGEEDENWCRRRIYFFSAGTFWCGISAAASKAVANEGETAPCRAVPCRNAIIIKIGTTQDSRHAVLLCCSLHMGYTYADVACSPLDSNALGRAHFLPFFLI